MDIAEILKNEQGKGFWCDVSCTVKKPKSKLMTGDEWTQECTLSDLSGDIAAEILLSGLSLERGNKIRVVRAEVQNAEKGVKLFVSAYVPETISEPVPDTHYTPAELDQNKGTNWDEIARRGIRKDLVCALVDRGGLVFGDERWQHILALTERIFSGK